MAETELVTRLPSKRDEYEIVAFYDSETPDDMPDLHIRIGEPTLTGRVSSVREVVVRLPLDWGPMDHAEFWARLKDAADVALARIVEVDDAK